MKNIDCESNGHVFKLKTFKGIKTGATDRYSGYEWWIQRIETGATDGYMDMVRMEWKMTR